MTNDHKPSSGHVFETMHIRKTDVFLDIDFNLQPSKVLCRADANMIVIHRQEGQELIQREAAIINNPTKALHNLLGDLRSEQLRQGIVK